MSSYSIPYVGNLIRPEEVLSTLGPGISEEVLSFWNTYDELSFDSGVSLYGYAEACVQRITYEVDEYVADYYLMGTDGGGVGIFLERGDTTHRVYYLGLGALGSSSFTEGDQSFFDWIAGGAMLEEEEEGEVVNLVIEQSPEELVKFTFDLKKAFGLTMSMGELKAAVEAGNYVLYSNIGVGVYGDTVDKLNDTYGKCLVYRPAIK